MATKIKLALCMIVKPDDKEAELLSRALNYISPHVDGIFITITGKNEKVEQVAKMYGAKVSYYKWDFDFSAARNFNFSQVTKDFTHIIWQDADDVIRGAEKLKETIKANRDVDAFTMNYLYWFDADKNPIVVHLKTQIVKNDNCVEWMGELHEDFKPNRELKQKLIEGIDRLHLTDEKRVGENAQRNLEVAKSQAKKHPNDPRIWWNLGNSYKATGHNKEAMENFDKFLATSKSDDEKYIALLRMAEIYLAQGEYAKALVSGRMAIGTKPDYPDAYFTIGNICFEMKDFAAAKESYVMGLKKKPPVLQIIVYNPRDYDYIPLKNLARIYFNLGQPMMALTCLKQARQIVPGDKEIDNLIKMMEVEAKREEEVIKKVEKLSEAKNLEELKKGLDEVPDDLKSHPIICNIRNRNIIKQSSSGRDVVFFCGQTQEEWTPETAKEKGIGGSEEAIINLSTGLAKRGWNVVVYNSCGHQEQKFDGVIYRPFWSWNHFDKQDVTVFWRHPRLVDHPINSDKVYIDLHDAIGPGEFTEERLGRITKIMVKSKAHRDLFPDVPDDKFFIAPNGIDLSLFENGPARDPYYIVNFSSPDRSLTATMDIFEEAYKRVSKDIQKRMKLGWFYGWALFDTLRIAPAEKEWSEATKGRFEALRAKGMAIGGERINHLDVACQNMKAGLLLYPSEFYEIDWVGGSKAHIAGALIMTAGFAAQKEKVKRGVVIPSKKTIKNWADIPGCDYSIVDPEQKEMFVKALVDYLESVESDRGESRAVCEAWAREKFDREKITDAWNDELRAPIKK